MTLLPKATKNSIQPSTISSILLPGQCDTYHATYNSTQTTMRSRKISLISTSKRDFETSFLIFAIRSNQYPLEQDAGLGMGKETSIE
jgi:hypothetical protein